MELEVERTYLVKYIPEGLKKAKSIELLDLYIPGTIVENAHLRIRKRGDKLEITKKIPVSGTDSSEQNEHTIPLDEKEFEILNSVSGGKKVHKMRYLYPYAEGKICELDVFVDDLEGLVVADFEFNSTEEKDSFEVPDFCLAEVTQDVLIAGGFLAGKSYTDIEEGLNGYNYKKLSV